MWIWIQLLPIAPKEEELPGEEEHLTKFRLWISACPHFTNRKVALYNRILT
jgi:hypothetical protein